MLDALFADIAERGWNVTSICQIHEWAWQVKLWDGTGFRCGQSETLTWTIECAILSDPIEPEYFAGPIAEPVKISALSLGLIPEKRITRRF